MSAIARNQVFSAVHTVGGLLPADMLVRIAEGKDVPGAKPADYKVVGSRSVNDDAERHWEYLKSVWKDLRKQLPADKDGSPASDPTGLALTQWVEPLFSELGFGVLTSVAGGSITADDDPEKTFPLSHRWRHVPIHVPVWGTELDRRPGGAGTVPPQSLVQEALNRTSDHLWAVVTNGRQLRLLRDSSALATASYVEFDLEAIFDGELFSEFVLLYRLLHVSRFEVAEDAAPSSCVLEKWRTDAVTSGTRALEQLRKGVQEAITTLGTGFLKHPANTRLREGLDTKELHGALLRMVYRLLFLFVAEDRDALHPPNAPEQAKERYAAYFSSARLRRHARRRRGTTHADQYRVLRIVLDALGGNGEQNEDGRPELALPALGGLFTDTEADAPLRGLELSNESLLGAVRHLAQVRDPGSRRWRGVDYRNLDAEELGSVYESLLELVPRHSAADRTFELVEVAGNDRKTTGSYYTPSSLIETLLDSSLDPVIDDAVKRGEEQATKKGELDASETIVAELLKLTVCDPACGSGHFLVAAARRIAKRVAAVRERNPEPTLDAVRHAMHEVVARCIYGVDLNPMAVELAKVSLWLEALEPGKPLTFLDAHVKRGNALIGATPKLMKDGIPDEAFKPIEGDDRKYARFLAKTNKEERGGQLSVLDIGDVSVKVTNTAFAQQLRQITTTRADSLAQVRQQEAAYREWTSADDYVRDRRAADAWCAAFVWKKAEDAPRAVTQEVFRNLSKAKQGNGAPFTTVEEIDRLRDQYRFFHWHLEFPNVFSVPEGNGGVDEFTGWAGGFACVLGNPPWERIKLQEQEFFAQRDEEIATARNAAARKALISGLKNDPDRSGLYQDFEDAKRRAEGESHFLRAGGRYPLTGRGDINTYAVFSETDRTLTGPHGRMGVIVPTGIATDATTQYFFKDLVLNGSIAALYDFENAAPLFPGVHRSFKFCILSLAGRETREPEASFAFFLQDPTELEAVDKSFTMTPEEITLLNPNTGTCPVFRSRRDAEISLGIYRRIPVLAKAGGAPKGEWGFSYIEVLHLSHAASSLIAAPMGKSRVYPVYEAKMMHHFDHRWLTYGSEGIDRTSAFDEPVPRYWVPAGLVDGRLDGRWHRGWMLGWRDICRSTDERTVIFSALPRSAFANTLPMANVNHPGLAGCLIANLSSFVLDYLARQKVAGTHLTMNYLRQMPVVGPLVIDGHKGFIDSRSLELVYTSHAMADFARDIGDEEGPFLWDEERRAIMRAELDALFFHLYGINRDDVDYIMETFPIVKRKDEAKHDGTYRTKERILEIYDRMAEAGVSLDTPLIDGENFTSALTPPPGHGPRHAPA
ncbi:N-6 DNA methylase [Streptomonospora nanhaiensis]|uniref:site-specific DNA-methyltransferase (adenine-specific) n=1 Tax=Streptomonospora nanhaiensis TaxID=1323731 RepID=A0ABY6YTF6_9ACTN|nr:DNA methyltransferase [Streptomonospora nanhaiensis]WAE75498.1 N-6 DNA methylase [Streptomonospora nanhaiensis]